MITAVFVFAVLKKGGLKFIPERGNFDQRPLVDRPGVRA